jgi:Deacetylase PdaC/Protein of unknown function (DUF3298)
MKKLFSITTLLFLFLTACQMDKKIPPITFKKQSIKQEVGKDGDANTFSCDINYLVAEGGTPEIIKAINDTIQNEIATSISALGEDSVLVKMDINAAIAKYRASYENVVSEVAKTPENERFEVHYSASMDFKEKNRNAKVICIESGNSFFTGGAHPFSYASSYVFDIATGKTINLKDLVKDEAKFLKIIEENVRKVHDISADKSLEAEGFFLDETTKKFALPLNFALSNDQKNIEFVYNSYEIAAYAFGPTELSIPFETLKDCLSLERLK